MQLDLRQGQEVERRLLVEDMSMARQSAEDKLEMTRRMHAEEKKRLETEIEDLRGKLRPHN